MGDGDTLRVLDGGLNAVRIRVASIDAPEMAQTPYGRQAREAIRALVAIGFTGNLKVQTKDRNGRNVAEVFTLNGANARPTRVLQGHAFAYGQSLKQ